MNSFFDTNYQTPNTLKVRLSRRNFLKSAAAATTASGVSISVLASDKIILADINIEPWRTLNSTLEHLLPSSASGPGATEIQAIHYLYNVITLQPTDKEEISFIKNGVGWLNGYTQGQYDLDFFQLSIEQKQTSLLSISKSRAGENWLSTLLSYIFEAMLAPPSYGGNPDGVGWQWLQHKAGFPLPKEGKRYYEIPGYAAIKVKNIDNKTRLKSDKKAT